MYNKTLIKSALLISILKHISTRSENELHLDDNIRLRPLAKNIPAVSKAEMNFKYEIVKALDVLLKHKAFSVQLICSYYHFNDVELSYYKNMLNWNCVSTNANINWDKYNWEEFLPYFITCPPHLQEQVEDNCIECSEKPYIPMVH